jgi:hypothetical protein
LEPSEGKEELEKQREKGHILSLSLSLSLSLCLQVDLLFSPSFAIKLGLRMVHHLPPPPFYPNTF